ncbi:MAG: arylsulfatase [Bacteroidota bacterium]
MMHSANSSAQRLALGIGMLAVCLAFLSSQPPSKPEKPDIIIIVADDLGYADVGFHGSDIQTPNLDWLAHQGVALEAFYTAPMCSPTRAGLMTGRYPLRFGLMRSVIPPHRNFGLDPEEDLLPEMLARAGYDRRACIGKWHLGHADPKWHPTNQGFTHFVGCYNGAADYFTREREGEVDWHHNEQTIKSEGYSTDLITQAAVDFIEETPEAEPYFLYLPYTAPHAPFQAKEADLVKYPARKGNQRTYAAMVDCMDQGVGKILEAVKARGKLENTFILFMSDNGGVGKVADNRPFRGGKLTVWEGGTHVVAAAYWPRGAVKGGRVVRQHLGYIDLYPTLQAMVDAERPSTLPLDGINVLAHLQGKSPIQPRPWFTYLDQGIQQREQMALHHGPWKVILRQDAPDYTGPQRKTEGLIFELDSLYHEHENLSENDLHSDRFERLTKRLLEYRGMVSPNQIPRYQEGKVGFRPPKDWIISP